MAEGNRETQSTSWDPMHTAETMVLKTPAQNEHSLIKLVPGESPHGRSMTQVNLDRDGKPSRFWWERF